MYHTILQIDILRVQRIDLSHTHSAVHFDKDLQAVIIPPIRWIFLLKHLDQALLFIRCYITNYKF